jgi:tetratricopeptide (TPR) repeat protein
MGFRIQKSIRLGKFLRLNISKSGIGFSAGLGPLRLGTGPAGTYFSADLPGPFSYRKRLNNRRPLDYVDPSRKPKTKAKPAPAPSPPPSPGLFAPRREKELAKGLQAYEAANTETALEHFLAVAAEEPGAAILAASILAEGDNKDFRASELLEGVIQSDEEFPSPLMEKYLAGLEVEVNLTDHVSVLVPIDGLAATLLLVELYQAQRRPREAIALLEEVAELSPEPVLVLSLCELYAKRELWPGIIEWASQIEPVDDVTLEIVIYYGRALQDKGLHEAAISVFSKGLRKKAGRNPQLLREAAYWRAVSYQTQGQHKQALRELQFVFAEDPHFKDVAQRLAEISIR